MGWAQPSRQNEFLHLQRTVDELSEQLRVVQWALQVSRFAKVWALEMEPLNSCLRCAIGAYGQI